MSREYAEGRIRDALKLCKGNPTRTRQQVMAWAMEDIKLLQALTRPHLTGIVAHAVGRVIHREGTEEQTVEMPEIPEGIDMTPESFGKEILGILSSRDTAIFGQESAAPRAGRKQASRSHIEAMRKIAKKKDKDF